MPNTPRNSSKGPVEIVDPRWLLKAGALAFAAALALAYATLCLLFYQGQWQLVLAPTATVGATPASLSLNFTSVTFGSAKLTGWFIPSDSTADPTVLLLHSGNGNMADALPSAQTLHAARLNIFLFDYRGFGASPSPHPTETRMQDDAAAAFDYLLHTRSLAPANLLLYGEGVGASLATHLATQHSDIAGLMLIHPTGDFTTQVEQDPRARLVPVWLLFHEKFPLAAPLRSLATPKLLVMTEEEPFQLDPHQIEDPKLTVEIGLRADDPAEPLRSINRFLDTYVSRTPQPLK